MNLERTVKYQQDLIAHLELDNKSLEKENKNLKERNEEINKAFLELREEHDAMLKDFQEELLHMKQLTETVREFLGDAYQSKKKYDSKMNELFKDIKQDIKRKRIVVKDDE